MGGLLGTATTSKDGLQSKYFAAIQTVDVNTVAYNNCLKIKKISGFSALFSITSGSNYSNLYYIGFTENTNPVAKIKSLAVFLSTNKLYAKQDAEYIYISKSYGAANPITFIPLTETSDNSIFEYSKIAISEVPSDATDIEVV